MKHDIPGLETKLRGIKRALAEVGSPSAIDDLIQVIHKPGWTTVAEFALMSAMADSLQKQLDTASAHFSQLRDAAGKVGEPS
jgi:hypothetical protein